MYEDFYGLNRRPFAAAPDADFTVETPAVSDAVARLDRCIRQGRGIAVLTAQSGIGKTHLCHRLAQIWLPEFQVVLLPNAGFPSGRGLLQAILAELDQPYQRLKETELRIELKAVARDVRQTSSGLVLILDEAHRYSERLLEEIRLIANLVDAGEPLIRILLAGKPDLEDTLADPGQSGLNERIGELVTLTRLTSDESRQYLDERSALAGSSVESLFDSDAVELIVRACGGIPRCLNQLADHALLLGYVAERRPVDAALVRDALDDLKRLPLQWQDPPAPTIIVDSSSDDFDALPAAGGSIIEIGGLDGEDFSVDATCSAATLAERPAAPLAVLSELHTADELPTTVMPPPATETISDRFAKIDASIARQRWFDDLDRSEPSPADYRETIEDETLSAAELRLASGPLEVLDQIEPLISAEIEAASPVSETAADTSSSAGPACPTARVEPAAAKRIGPEFRFAGGQRPQPRDLRHATLFRDLRRGGHLHGR